ncbi:TrpB-like pyridoxal phosphate-dependent enzyme [Streptomyces xiaopingdaonensis]|uniref:TrpB-like pyridoxal phosphate-dependent enzyme n=1 Tax=Streptomyces xiaopingdaonensis TaxID=1565415 RepID=UPI000306F9F3|nr:TrpB-like pyridoxal phosphate-dependent enzyme [Streptomyces xiaopingdaonensis]
MSAGTAPHEPGTAAAGVPRRWRSVLPHLDEPLPADLPPEEASGEDVHINLPMELVRQSLHTREFWDIPQEVADAYRSFRPTPLWRARGFEAAIGARVPVWVKYEGSNISGSHKLNTALAQAYYYKRAGVRELVTGTGAGQWGTALAAACAMFGMRCTVFMVGSSLEKKPYRGVLMRLLGAEVHASPSDLTKVAAADDGSRGNSLTLAIGEAVEYARNRAGAAFCIGSGETYSILHQSVIGLESEEQLAAQDAEVDAVVGAVGAGSNFGGIALPFFASARGAGRRPPRLVAAESAASPKLSRGVYAYDKTDATGTSPREAMYTIGSEYRIPDSHSGGLRYHGAAKVISALRHAGQTDAVAVGQVEALEASRKFTLHEMTLPAPESGHALAVAARLACQDGGDGGTSEKGVLVCLSGHGYLDLGAYQQLLAGQLSDRDPDPAVLGAAMAELPLVGTPAGAEALLGGAL